jgi:alpha-mannosidase
VLPGPPQELALTLFRSVGWLSREDLVTRTGHAGPAIETPGAQVLGGHRVRYSLFFHKGDWQDGGVWRAAESSILPLLPGRGEAITTAASLIELEPACIQMTALLPRPGGYDLRFLNASDASTRARVRLQPQPSEVVALTLADNLRERLTPRHDVVRIAVRPWEIVTLRVTR